jgi:hypothetical protein
MRLPATSTEAEQASWCLERQRRMTLSQSAAHLPTKAFRRTRYEPEQDVGIDFSAEHEEALATRRMLRQPGEAAD